MKTKTSILLFFLIPFALIAQDETQAEEPPYLAKISAEACNCIAEMDVNASKKTKSDEIASCINSAILLYKVQQSMVPEKVIEALKRSSFNVDSIKKINENNDFNIVLDGEYYEEVETFLYNYCPELKEIYFTENKKHAFSYSKNKKALEWYKKGQFAFQMEDYDKAIEFFEKAVEEDKEFAFAWDNLGYSYRKKGEYKKAIKYYKKSLALNPKGKMPLMNIGVAYELNKDFKKAIKAYEEYKQIYKNDPEAYYGLGRIYYMEKDYVPALENMFQAYLLYSKMGSPYRIDAETHISHIYLEMKEKGNLEKFNEIAEKYNVGISE